MLIFYWFMLVDFSARVSRFLRSLRSVEMTSGCDSFRDVAPSTAPSASLGMTVLGMTLLGMTLLGMTGKDDRDYQSFAHLLYWVVDWSFLNLLISILIE